MEPASAVADAPSGPSETAGSSKAVDTTREISPAADSSDSDKGLLEKPVFAHAAGGPTAGLVAKIKELQQRFKETPGVTLKERSATRVCYCYYSP